MRIIFVKFKYFYSFYLFFLFSGFLYYSYISISIGNFPQLKKLNNGNYIVISSTGIYFLDSTLTIKFNTIDFDEPIYTDDSSTLSTTINQFSNEERNYIISLFKKNLYIFFLLLAFLTKEENISFINQENIYSIIPYGHSENEYYFSIIYIYKGETNDLYFIKGIYNSNLNEITFSEPYISWFTVFLLILCLMLLNHYPAN